MREIINLNFGKCGTQVGKDFWAVICGEHKINEVGDFEVIENSNPHVLFKERRNKYIPRSVFIDSDPSSFDSVACSGYGKLFDLEQVVTYNEGSIKTFTRGYYEVGGELIDIILEKVRKEIELTDSIQGFYINHSVGGGVGSGLFSRSIDTLKDYYPEAFIFTNSLFPELDHSSSDNVFEHLNSLLSFNSLINSVDMVNVMDNKALLNLCSKKLKIIEPTYSDMNRLVSNVSSNNTCTLRFKSEMNSDFRKLACNVVPLPKIHFLISSLHPLPCKESIDYRNTSLSKISYRLSLSNLSFANVSESIGRYFTTTYCVRGKASTYEVENFVFDQWGSRNWSNFVEYIRTNSKICFCEVPLKDYNISVSTLGNNSIVGTYFKRILQECQYQLKDRKLKYILAKEGLDITEINVKTDEIQSIIDTYENLQDASAGDDA